MGRLGMLLALAVALALSSGHVPAYGAQEENIVMDGSTTVGPIAKAFAEYYMAKYPDVNITVSESGSGNGASGLIRKDCHIANMSRFMKDKEFKLAVANGVTPVAHVVAMDGIAIVVHPANPVRNLTVDQVRDIYAGRITNWKEVGGPDVGIVVISRDTNSGTYETFEKKVMAKARITPSAEYLGSNGAIRQKVMDTRAAVGYVGLGFLEGVKALTVNGVEPTRSTVSSGRYPVSRPLFMFTDGYPELGGHVHALVTLHLTKKGQEIVETIGFVPVTDY